MTKTLLVEELNIELMENEILTEGKEKIYKIKGPFIESNIKNRNNRIYPGPIVKKEVDRYQTLIKEGRAVGQMEHPDTLEISLPDISHRIIKLEFEDDNVVMGEALILNTPKGIITKGLMDGGVRLATSTRGSGTLKEGVVQSDYNYICNDLVFSPSAPHCFVDSILENRVQWLLDGDVLKEVEIETLQDRLKDFRGDDIATVVSEVFERALTFAMNK